ncbi:transcriptional regulator, TetR family [Corynebacterium kutscheri]|uniref:Transcriptional regulator, TetR family n=1 Tax=Corynebacterium kutscheri TaxID=35755 RepID=A0A0F6R0I2_9CORY|nr:TetR/AcrR family transcriptional regulator [Corynebacterium kutscheri]AKE40433.1 transcriptional regulator, TetR family [Corynebacterium kutscheri]VEH10826.1 probable dihydroxyacetone kinase regulator [Corynebacterium kutscheri]
MDAREKISVALKQELALVPLKKVTVAAVAKRAGITRQTFYYHFADVEDAAVWVFQHEVGAHILSHASYRRWVPGLIQLMNYMSDHAEQVDAILNSLSVQQTEQFFFQQLRIMMSAIVSELGGDKLHAADRRFIIDHYTLAVVGHLLHWLNNNRREPPEALVKNISFIMCGHGIESIHRFRERG